MDNLGLKRYAQLLVKTGVNMQEGQELVIQADVNCAYFVEMVTDYAYEAGAKNVVVKWECEHNTRARFLHAADEVFTECPPYLPVFFDYMDMKNACYLYIDNEDPDLLVGVAPSRLKAWQMAKNTALTSHMKRTMENSIRWAIGAIPSVKWALKMFPDCTEEVAVEKLWDAIAKAARIDNDDPIAAWKTHIATFTKRVELLDKYNFKSLKLKNSIGTDVTIEMPKNHFWCGGAEKATDGKFFSANIPSEEIFTCPKNSGVNGKIVASMPLIYNGVEISGFEFEFVGGSVVKYKADKNEETLKNILDMDAGAKMLGEIALVPYDSPISNMNMLFYSTLFDENAACHVALGRAYPCVTDYDKLNKDELDARGLNDSLVHIDFMFGTSDLSIVGVTEEGKEIAVFIDGNFAF